MYGVITGLNPASVVIDGTAKYVSNFRSSISTIYSMHCGRNWLYVTPKSIYNLW